MLNFVMFAEEGFLKHQCAEGFAENFADSGRKTDMPHIKNSYIRRMMI